MNRRRINPGAMRTAARCALAATALCVVSLVGGCTTSGTTPSATSPSATATQFGTTYTYLPVNDLPQDDQRPVLSPEQQEKLRKELAAVRDRQVPAAGKAPAAKPGATTAAAK